MSKKVGYFWFIVGIILLASGSSAWIVFFVIGLFWMLNGDDD